MSEMLHVSAQGWIPSTRAKEKRSVVSCRRGPTRFVCASRCPSPWQSSSMHMSVCPPRHAHAETGSHLHLLYARGPCFGNTVYIALGSFMHVVCPHVKGQRHNEMPLSVPYRTFITLFYFHTTHLIFPPRPHTHILFAMSDLHHNAMTAPRPADAECDTST